MNEFTIGIPIHNKSHMIADIVDGLADSIQEPANYIFIFDGCTDDSKDELDKHKHKLNGDIKILETPNIYQLLTNNLLMEMFETDKLIIFQDDMVLTDKNYLNNIRMVADKYGDKLGLLGSRDGFGRDYSNMHSSIFSESKVHVRLNPGEYAETLILNIGPIVLSKRLISLVGKFDEVYGKGAYEEMEYSLKCNQQHELTNIVLGVSLIHSKHSHKIQLDKQCTDSETLNRYFSLNCRIFNDRWAHIAGRL